MEVYHGKSIVNWIYTYRRDKCTDNLLPDTTKYILRIIEGTEFGHLIDPVTGNPADLITNLSHTNYGEASFRYVADGVNPVVEDTAIVRIAATDSRIMPCDVTILIREDTTSHVKAYFERENITAGETVNIIIKNVDRYGVERDYPPETLFEAAVIKGCDIGKINGSGTHLAGIRQPLTFVVADTVNAEDSVVVLRIGAPPINGNAALRVVSKNQEPVLLKKINRANEVRGERKQDEKSVARNSYEAPCTIYTPTYTDNADAKAKIGDDCEKIAKCKTTNPPVVPAFELIPEPLQFTNNECNLNTKMRGGFGLPLIAENYVNTPIIKVCFNILEKHWQINIEPVNKMSINYFLDFCLENIRRMHKCPLFKITDVDTIPRIRLAKAFDDIESQKKYGGGEDYYVFEATVAHESVHKSHFVKLIEEVYNNYSFATEFLNFRPKCTEIKGESNVLQMAKTHVKNKIDLFSIMLEYAWNQLKVSGDYEKKVQENITVKNILNAYQERLLE
jgi:hypothetical protein